MSMNLHDTILHGDALSMLRTLPGESVQCCVTSPPYWSLRDYGVPGQLGLEATPDEYVARMVAVFREVKRVLRNDGTCWINMGDSYFGDSPVRKTSAEAFSKTWDPSQTRSRGGSRRSAASHDGLKPKDLIGMPWRLAFALQADGWYLRADIIWHKPNPMPESVSDRPTKSHEYLFLLSKRATYYYDAEAIREPHSEIRDWPTWEQRKAAGEPMRRGDPGQSGAVCHFAGIGGHPAGRNKRSVWTVATAPFAQAHFATFPPKLIEPCILAGSASKACEHCGAPWRRVVERETNWQERRKAGAWAGNLGVSATYQNGVHGKGMSHDLGSLRSTTTDWQPTCRCADNTGSARSVVLDPFMGAGTVGVVCRRHSRHYLGIELNAAYIAMAETRIANEVQPALWTAQGGAA